MPKVTILSQEELNRVFTPASRSSLREEEMKPYIEAVEQLSEEFTGGIIELDEDEQPRQAMMRLHQAARRAGKPIRFKRAGKGDHAIRFRLQTPEESERLKERGKALAASRSGQRATKTLQAHLETQLEEVKTKPVPKPTAKK